MTESPDYDKLFDHEYDGIREYDNPLPSWWTTVWWLTVAFSAVYVAWFHMGAGPSIEQQYEQAVARHIEQQLAGLGEIGTDTESIIRLSRNEEMMVAMGGLFRGNCSQCHGNDGGGNVGPNLTDDHYKNIETPADIYDSIANGIPGTSMPEWSNRLREPQMILLAAYVTQLRGTFASGGKEPEGEVIPPWPDVPPAEESAPSDEGDRTADARTSTTDRG